MIEFDVDMGYLLEEGELDCVVLNDENGEHEPIEFVPKLGGGECEVELRESGWGGYTRHCGNCGADLDCDTRNKQNYCPKCGKAVKR